METNVGMVQGAWSQLIAKGDSLKNGSADTGRNQTAARLADRINRIATFHVMSLLAHARELEAQGRSIIHLEIGEPDFPTPQPIISAGMQALQRGLTSYTTALGLPLLREAIAEFYRQRYHVHVPARRIIITPGASGALLLTMSVLLNPNDEVLISDPCYPCNRNFIEMMDGRAITVPVDASTDYQLTAQAIEQYWTKRSVAAMLASPSNPTGTVIAQNELQAIFAKLTQHHARLIVDEIYHGLTYDGDVPTALEISDELFVISSFSKYFGMTGWRLGWLVVPDQYVSAVEKVAQNIFLASSTPAQYAALAAFNDETIDILEQRKAEFQRRRDYLFDALSDIGFGISGKPRGAFYLYANCSRFTDNSFEFANRLLEETGVTITPGIDFGQHRAHQHVRFSYTTSLEKLEQAVGQLATYLQKT